MKSEQELKDLLQKEQLILEKPIQKPIETEKKPLESLSWFQRMIGQKTEQTLPNSTKTTLLKQFESLRKRLNTLRQTSKYLNEKLQQLQQYKTTNKSSEKPVNTGINPNKDNGMTI